MPTLPPDGVDESARYDVQLTSLMVGCGSGFIQRLKTISSVEFATAFALRPNLMAWFLGAGASAASGIPTGFAMIRDFKAQIFCQKNNLAKGDIDSADPVWIDRIDAFFRRTAILPPEGDPEEYAKAFEAVYPEPRHRRQYISDAIAKGTPCFGHSVLGGLVAARKADCIFTTNFDHLVEDASQSANAALDSADQVKPTVAAIDSSGRARRCLNESDWPMIAKLHGDYQSSSIKNTSPELEKQDEEMRGVLVDSCQRFGLVVVGYSGRDASIMDALSSVLESTSPFPNGLYWVAPSPSRLMPDVRTFLERAASVGVDVSIVVCDTFDELAADIIKVLELPKVLAEKIMAGRPTPRLVPATIQADEARRFPILRYSALLIESMPRRARQLLLEKPASTGVIRAALKNARCKAIVAANGREVALFGDEQNAVNALSEFGARVGGEVSLDPLRDSRAKGLVYDALARSLSRKVPLIPRLKRSGHSLIVAAPRDDEDQERAKNIERQLEGLRRAYGGNLSGKVPGLGYPFYEGVFLKLDYVAERWWCCFEPFTFVDIPKPETTHDALSDDASTSSSGFLVRRLGGDPAGDWRRERWAQRYNKNWSSIIDAWAKLLTSQGSDIQAFWLGDGGGTQAEFRIGSITAWSRPSHHDPYFDRRK